MKYYYKILIFKSLLFVADFSTAQTFDFLPKSTTSQIIKHKYLTISYSEEYKQAEWVTYMLTSQRLNGIIKREDKFTTDPLIYSNTASPNDYRKSGYDRGHLAPAADMKFNEIAMKECFYMSNISPQLPGFNRGIWKKLEDQVRQWAIEDDTLYIVTAGILTYINKKIGINRVGVPNTFYKIILKYTSKEKKAIAFLIPNQKSDESIFYYATTIDVIEKLTGIDFFPKLPDIIEIELESQININLWK